MIYGPAFGIQIISVLGYYKPVHLLKVYEELCFVPPGNFIDFWVIFDEEHFQIRN